MRPGQFQELHSELMEGDDSFPSSIHGYSSLEAAQGMAVSSPLNERGIGSKARGQIGFYEVVCIPLYTVIMRIFLEAEDCLTAVKNNMEIWKKRLADEIAGQEAISDGKYRGS
jgi:hypothetical protein